MVFKNIEENYDKYRWFFTSSGKLVVGGKSARQNEKLVKKLIEGEDKVLLMHTARPGSPFSAILGPIEKLDERDLEEAAIFTASFSQQWKEGGGKIKVNAFTNKDVYKEKKMKEGTFGVKGKEKGEKVELKLYLKKQDGKLRAVPFQEGEVSITPGEMSKEKAAELISKKLNVDKEEVVQALPAGGFNIHIGGKESKKYGRD